MTTPPDFASLFSPDPPQWGLRGDPHLWQALQIRTRGLPMPSSLADLQSQLAAQFEAECGHPLSHPHDFRVERFAKGGMSSGMVCMAFWRERALPLLCERHAQAHGVDGN